MMHKTRRTPKLPRGPTPDPFIGLSSAQPNPSRERTTPGTEPTMTLPARSAGKERNPPMQIGSLVELTALLQEPSIRPLVQNEAAAHRVRLDTALRRQAPRLRIGPPRPLPRQTGGSTPANNNGGNPDVVR